MRNAVGEIMIDAILEAASSDPVSQMVLADWLEDQGCADESQATREYYLAPVAVWQCLYARWDCGSGNSGGFGSYGGAGGSGGFDGSGNV